jgi:hypothetical protein
MPAGILSFNKSALSNVISLNPNLEEIIKSFNVSDRIKIKWFTFIII